MCIFYNCQVRFKFTSTIWVLLLVFVAAGTLAACSSNNSGDARVVEGLAAFDAEDYPLAAHKFEQAIRLGVADYELAEVYTVLGRAYEETTQLDKAIAAYQKATEIDPNYYKAWVNLGVAHRLTGNLDNAEKSYNQALRIEPDYAELHASLGALHIFKNDPEKALQSLSQAISLDPQLAVAHANIAVAYAMVGQFDLSDAELNQATALGYPNAAIIKARINVLKALDN